MQRFPRTPSRPPRTLSSKLWRAIFHAASNKKEIQILAVFYLLSNFCSLFPISTKTDAWERDLVKRRSCDFFFANFYHIFWQMARWKKTGASLTSFLAFAAVLQTRRRIPRATATPVSLQSNQLSRSASSSLCSISQSLTRFMSSRLTLQSPPEPL